MGEPVIVGSGIDVVEIARIGRILERHGERFAERVFTPREIRTCAARRRSHLHFALRFAAKEAAMKAVGSGWADGARWVDIETLSDTDGSADPLRLALRGRIAELAGRSGPVRSHLSVARSRSHAMAVVLLETRVP